VLHYTKEEGTVNCVKGLGDAKFDKESRDLLLVKSFNNCMHIHIANTNTSSLHKAVWLLLIRFFSSGLSLFAKILATRLAKLCVRLMGLYSEIFSGHSFFGMSTT
jgi:hypothetical protein